MTGQFASAAWTVAIALFVTFVVIVGGGFWMISRRKQTGGSGEAADSQKRANILLVQVDDLTKDAENEYDFALAQFGEARTTDFRKALDNAKASLSEAFGLQQKLDDAYPDTEIQRHDWTGRIIHLCETTKAELQTQTQAFTKLRNLEQDAPADLKSVEQALVEFRKRAGSAEETAKKLKLQFADAAIASVADNLELAEKSAAQAEKDAAVAAKRLADRGSTGADTVSDDSQSQTVPELIQSARSQLAKAGDFLAGIEHLDSQLEEAVKTVRSLRDSTRASLAEAKALRDAPPDATSSSQIAEAMTQVEQALATDPKDSDPLSTLETLRQANASLDSSMAGARNQQRRLEGARTALVGAMVSAKSQLAATSDYINARRGGVGAEARVRLAEADRLLKVAEAESDPVAALDIARRSATLSRDADALARFDLMRR